VTNKASLFALPLLETAGLLAYFAFVLCADSPENRKPGPELLLAACRRLEIRPRELLCVGDSVADVAAARAAGCPVAAVSYGYNGGRSIALAHPDWLVGGLPEISGLSDVPHAVSAHA
jgi:phosphoglycolate phosphatase